MAKYQLADSFKQQSFSFQCRPLGPAEVVTELLVLLARVLRGAALQLARLLLLPFVSMAVLAQQHSGVWWGVLGHCAWVAGEAGSDCGTAMSVSGEGSAVIKCLCVCVFGDWVHVCMSILVCVYGGGGCICRLWMLHC